MASRKFKTHCRIIDYVDSVDPELASILRGTCVDMTLNSSRQKPGITFLMPQDKAYRKKIADLAESSKVEDVHQAADMLNALIIRDVFKQPSDWLAKKDDIPNSLFPYQHVEIDSVAGKEVVFKSGARASLDAGFIDSSRKANLAVWKLTGEIPVTTDKNATLKYSKSAGAKKGGYAVDNMENRKLRWKIALAVENAYLLCELSRRNDSSNGLNDVYYKYTMSLVNYILNQWGGSGNQSVLYSRVLPLLSFDQLDFYLLVEPHKTTGNYLLDDMLIQEWWENKNMNFCLRSCMKKVEDLIKAGSGALVYTDREQLIGQIASQRRRVGALIEPRPRQSAEVICAEYAKLEATNAIDGLGPVFPAELAAYYQSEPGLKMVQDELRYLTYGAFKRIEQDAVFDRSEFNRILNVIGDYLIAPTKDDRLRVVQILNPNSIKWQINPIEKVQEIRIFLNSTMYMYVLLTRDECENIKSKYSVARPNPNEIVLFFIQKGIYQKHDRLIMGKNAQANDNIASLLESLDVATLDPELRKRIAARLNV